MKGSVELPAGSLPSFASNKVRAELTVPYRLQVGVRNQTTDKLAIEFDLTRTGWSSFDRLHVTQEQYGFTIVDSKNDWKDVNAYRLGVTYDISQATQLRVGYTFDETPQDDDYFSPRVPDADRTAAGHRPAGAGRRNDAGARSGGAGSGVMRMRHTLLLSGAALLLAACNTTPTKQVQTAPTPPPADIRVEESIGFTIVETAEIDAAVRVDYDRALALIAQGRINDGIAVLETVVEQAPELSAPRVDLAIAWHRLDDLDAAEEQLDKVLEINPQHPIALNELGIVYRKTARFAEARQSYEAALAVYPGYHYARRNLAVICELYLADLECALASYEAYMKTVPGDEEASMWVAAVRLRMDQGG